MEGGIRIVTDCDLCDVDYFCKICNFLSLGTKSAIEINLNPISAHTRNRICENEEQLPTIYSIHGISFKNN